MSKRKIKKAKEETETTEKKSNVLVRAGKKTGSTVANGVKKVSEWRKARKERKLNKSTHKCTKSIIKELKKVNKDIQRIELNNDLVARKEYLTKLERVRKIT